MNEFDDLNQKREIAQIKDLDKVFKMVTYGYRF